MADQTSQGALIAEVFGKVLDGLSRMPDRAAGIVQALNPAPIATAMGQLVQALTSVPPALQQFVGAFDPGAVALLGQMMRDLSATIGYALRPVLEGMVQIVGQLTSELAPVMVAMRPVIADIMGLFLTVMKPVIIGVAEALRSVVEVVRVFMPVIRVLGAVVEGVVTVFTTVTRIVGTFLAAVLGGIMTNDLSGAVEAVRTAFGELAKMILTVTDSLLRLFGMADIANRILQGFAARPQGRIAAAPTDVGVSAMQDIYRQRLEASARGIGGMTPQERTNTILADIERHARELLARSREGNGNERVVRRAREAIGPPPTHMIQLGAWMALQQALNLLDGGRP